MLTEIVAYRGELTSHHPRFHPASPAAAQDIDIETAKGILPIEHDLKEHPEKSLEARAWLIGRVSALIHDVPPAKEIVESMVNDAVKIIQGNAAKISVKAKL